MTNSTDRQPTDAALRTTPVTAHVWSDPCSSNETMMGRNEGAHARPHFHARYAGQVASVDFSGELIAGSLPGRAFSLVVEWAALHADELLANWERARHDEPLRPIDPLP